MPAPLPIDDVLPELLAALRKNSSVVLQAPTGAGKTTRVPPAILDSGLANDKLIVMLEPRRLAARAAARRMAQERGGQLGGEIGYQVRFDRQNSEKTRVLVVTEGVLVRMLQDDPFLEPIGAIVFDEFHERSLDTDLALGMSRLVQQAVRPDLKLVVMSATLGVEAVAKYLSNCPVVVSEGRLFPVDISYEPRSPHQPWPATTAAAVIRLLDRTAGDVLVFLPGLGEIRQTARQLESFAREQNIAVLQLYGDLPAEQQDAALLRGERRKIVLATNVAETSVTVEGVTGVVDTGLQRSLIFDPSLGLDRLQLTNISQASADQRAGRAGRLQPGVCVRLWSQAQQRARPAQNEPEIRRVDLAGPVLQLACWGEAGVRDFPWFEPPREASVTQAEELLQRLGAMKEDGPTDLGRFLARLPIHPRLGRLLLEGERWGEPRRAALAAAMLAERDPFTRAADASRFHGPPRQGSRSDVLDRIEALEDFEERGQVDSFVGTINRHAAKFVLHARDHLLRVLDRERRRGALTPLIGHEGRKVVTPEEAFLRALFAAFPDRLARRREPLSPRGVLVGGRGVRLDPLSAVRDAELFVCLDVEGGQAESLVRQASAVERSWLAADQLNARVEIFFDSAAERVAARRRTRFADLLLDEAPAALPISDETAQVLAAAAALQLDRVLPAPDSAGWDYLQRVRSLALWMPDLKLPTLDDEHLLDLLVAVSHGCRSFDDVRQANWQGAIQSLLTPAQYQAVERDAPERIAVPSGSRITLQYEPGRPPILAVRIQEIFSLRDTPRIAAGRIKVLLHLLGPNYRPQQVTDDLASFWANGYPVIKKELKRRYPKHAWPNDPLTAQPEKKPQRKRSSE